MEVLLSINEYIVLLYQKYGVSMHRKSAKEQVVVALTGFERRTAERKSLRTSLISGCSEMY
jgi:hypothetical protein